jgi:phospholipid/cholesterol/gamma-HCH transport system substrate-binding protein
MRIRTWAVGLFVILGIGFFTAILFLIGSSHNIFGRHVEFYSDFSNIAGLQNGAGVRVSGLDAGTVTGIDIPAGSATKFHVRLHVASKVRQMIRIDSMVSIETEGIVGDKYVSIGPGTPGATEAFNGATLLSKEPLDIKAVMEKGSALLNDVDRSVNDVQGRLDVALDSVTKTVNHVNGLVVAVQPDVRIMAANARQLTARIDGIVADLNEGKGPIGLLLKDEATRSQLQAILSNVQQAASNLRSVSEGADQIIVDLKSRDLAQQAEVTLANVQAISQQLNEAMKGVFAPDETGNDGATNLRETLSNLNRGTTNLAEDTEALKHEFFFRGFFKRRGFYDLQQLAPADYLKACQHEKACTSREWLDASGLFAFGSGGKEQLTEAGRREIDEAVAPLVDSLLNHVVVVEGYCASGTPDEQFVVSRERADLVRQYLEEHFHLRHSDVGIVPLRNRPPQIAGRHSWNGVSIVFFQEGHEISTEVGPHIVSDNAAVRAHEQF